MEQLGYKVVEMPSKNPYEKRYCVIDNDGVIIDDAQGYGYKTMQNAHKAVWYKFKNGKEKTKEKEKVFKKFIKENKEFVKKLNNLIEDNIKGIWFGEELIECFIKELEKEFGIIVPVDIRKQLIK